MSQTPSIADLSAVSRAAADLAALVAPSIVQVHGRPRRQTVRQITQAMAVTASIQTRTEAQICIQMENGPAPRAR